MGINSSIDEKLSKSIINQFYLLKDNKHLKDAYLKSIDIDNDFILLPVSFCHCNDDFLIKNLTKWRNIYKHTFPNQFEATFDSTKNWLLKNLLENKNKILFLVIDNKGDCHGHIGLNIIDPEKRIIEIDNVMRWEDSKPGLFSHVLKNLIIWVNKTFLVESLCLRVLDDNEKAIKFYEKNNFVIEKKIPLVKIEKDSHISFIECDENKNDGKINKFFLKMIYAPPKYINKDLILTAGPSISSREAFYSYDAALNGWNRNWSKYLTTLENKFAEYIGVKHALATSSCTGALQIALMSLGIGKGDEVIVPDQTWVATAAAVKYVGAIPIFADIEIDTWNIDSNSIEHLINKNTKAIICVHMYGHPTRMDNILKIAKKYNLKLVEDAAPAIGAEWRNQKCGSFGDFSAFSFQGAKLMVTGEGGMLLTNNTGLYEKAKKIWDQGRNPNKVFWIDGEGVKFKMSNIQAAIGLGQLERINELIELKRRIFSWYSEGLSSLNQIQLNREVKNAKSIYWMSSLYIKEEFDFSRDKLISYLRSKNIDSRPVFPAISQYPIWPRDQKPQPIAYKVGQRSLNLPSGVTRTKEEILYICDEIKGFFNSI